MQKPHCNLQGFRAAVHLDKGNIAFLGTMANASSFTYLAQGKLDTRCLHTVLLNRLQCAWDCTAMSYSAQMLKCAHLRIWLMPLLRCICISVSCISLLSRNK